MTNNTPNVVSVKLKNNLNVEFKAENLAVLKLKSGDVLIEFFPEVAPNHITRLKQLINVGFYDGIIFHRVIKDFMAQTGDPTGTGRGGSGIKIQDEIKGAKHLPGVLSMANAGPGTDDSQFFITFVPTPWLDKAHTIFGRVVFGMEHVKKINDGGTESGAPKTTADKIISFKLFDGTNFDFNNLDALDTDKTLILQGAELVNN
jgi:peptidylprolyl isomerase